MNLRCLREQVIFCQLKERNRRNIGDISRFRDAELAKKGCSQLSSRFTPVSWALGYCLASRAAVPLAMPWIGPGPSVGAPRIHWR